jgi:hypothetical protein
MSNIYPKSLTIDTLTIESENPVLPLANGEYVADFNVNGGAIIKKGIVLGESSDINPMQGLVTYDNDESTLKVYHNLEKFGIVMDTISQTRYDDISITTTTTADVSVELDIGNLQLFSINIDPAGTTRYDISFDTTNLKSTETTSWYNIDIIINNDSSTEKGQIYFDGDTVLVSSKLTYQTNGSERYFNIVAGSNILFKLIYKDKSTVYVVERISFE